MHTSNSIIRFNIDGVNIDFVNITDASRAEAVRTIDFVKSRVDLPVQAVTVNSNVDGSIDIHYELFRKFERIRRITDYLSGSIDSWNDSKRAEERDRVKHDIDVNLEDSV